MQPITIWADSLNITKLLNYSRVFILGVQESFCKYEDESLWILFFLYVSWFLGADSGQISEETWNFQSIYGEAPSYLATLQLFMLIPRKVQAERKNWSRNSCPVIRRIYRVLTRNHFHFLLAYSLAKTFPQKHVYFLDF